MMEHVVPKPLPQTNLPPLRQVGKPLRRVDASLRCEDGRESIQNVGILVSVELLKGGEC